VRYNMSLGLANPGLGSCRAEWRSAGKRCAVVFNSAEHKHEKGKRGPKVPPYCTTMSRKPWHLWCSLTLHSGLLSAASRAFFRNNFGNRQQMRVPSFTLCSFSFETA